LIFYRLKILPRLNFPVREDFCLGHLQAEMSAGSATKPRSDLKL